jgi:stringent starvation protein B
VASFGALIYEDDASAPDKKRTLEALLARGPVLVHVDARRTEVAVPPRFRADPSLVLRFGYNLSPSIADLTVDDEGVAGTLTFAGQPFHCELPWTAVYAAMVEGEQRGTVWPEDVPEDVLTGSEPQAVAPTPAPAPGPTAPPVPAPAAPVEAKPDEEPRKRSHLKLVE